MKKKFARLSSFFMCTVLLLTASASAAGAEFSGMDQTGGYSGIGARIMRIGIYYGSEGKNSVELTLTRGDGFQFGIFDDNHCFIPAAGAAPALVKRITVMADPSSRFGFLVQNSVTGELLHTLDDGGLGYGLAVLPFSYAGEKTITKCGYPYYGAFRFERFTANNDLMTIVNYIPMDDYVKGVVPYEMSPSWPMEALKAQAICARTYALTRINVSHQNGFHFDLCDSTHCQAYKGVYSGSFADKTDQAVDETSGVTVRYNGEYCETVYSSSNGGASESNVNVNGKDIPYLIGKADPYEGMIENIIPNYHWSATFTGAQLQAKLVSRGYAGCGVITSVSTSQSAAGNVISITFTDINGKSFTLYRNDCRTALSLRSLRYSVSSESGAVPAGGSALTDPSGKILDLSQGVSVIDGNGNISVVLSGYIVTENGVQAVPASGGVAGTASGSVFTFTGTGWGHNVGLSQYGAYSMAQQGYTCKDILQFYYTGVTVG